MNGNAQHMELQRLTERLAATALESLLHAIDANDSETGAHVRRVAASARTVAEYADGDADLPLRVERVALFHDIGKIDQALFDIVHDGDRLTKAERRVIRSHPARGAAVVAPLAPFYPELPAGVRAHHERWDGSGYPDGLSGTDIPLEARLVAIADVFDALTHRRHYRPPSTNSQGWRVIASGRGTHFDPELTDLFLFPPVFAAAVRARREAMTYPGSTRKAGPRHTPGPADVVPEVSFRWRKGPGG
jgi:HD-GYP domain-containing protein (c-di-GMP phosphodiesterase class II)